MVSTSVCGTESSGSNPDRDLPFSVDPSMSKKLFYLFFFLYVRNAVAHCAAVIAGFTFFRLHPKVESSGLLFAFLFSFTTFYNVFFTFVTSNAFCLAHTPCAGPPILSFMCALTQPITYISSLPPFV